MYGPLSTQEALMLGDWLVAEDKKHNPDPRYVIPWSLNLEGRTPSEARSALRSVGYRMTLEDLMYQIRRKR